MYVILWYKHLFYKNIYHNNLDFITRIVTMFCHMSAAIYGYYNQSNSKY